MYFKVNFEYRSKTRKDFLVDEINPSEVYAISAFIEPNIYSMTVRADKNSHVVKFDTKVLNGLIEIDPKLNYILMRKIAYASIERLANARVQLVVAWAK